jgi:excisionase family DNA binding protein
MRIDTMSTKLLRMDEVAAYLDVTLARAYELVRQGVVPAVRIGRQIRVDPDRLEQWVAQGGRALEDEVEKQAVVRSRVRGG